MADQKISQLVSASTPLAGTEVLPIVQSSATVKVSAANITAGRAVSGASFSVTGSTVPTNGIYLPAANSVGVATNGTVKCTIDSSGNVGIGTSGQPDRLFVYANTASSALFVRNDGAGPLQTWATFGTTRMQLTAAGDLTASTGNFIVGTAGKGIDFSANTHAAGMTSELLNDYEEGTWAPNQGPGLTVVGAFSSSGTYTKVGRCVTVIGSVAGATSVAVGSGGLIVTNLPFTVSGAGQGAAGTGNVNQGAVVFAFNVQVYAMTAITAAASIDFTVTYFV